MSRAVITHFVQDHRKLCEKITLKKREISKRKYHAGKQGGQEEGAGLKNFKSNSSRRVSFPWGEPSTVMWLGSKV